MIRAANRKAFTLIEILVVIGIIMVLATLTVAAFSMRNSDKTRSAARIAQSAFLGAKDRALHAKELRGIRLTRDLTDTTLVNGFVYLQPLPIQTAGNYPVAGANNVSVGDAAGGTDYRTIVVSGTQGATWRTQDQNGIWPTGALQVRIPAGTGQWYQLQRQSTNAPYWGKIDASGNLNLFTQTVVTGAPIPNTSANASIDVQLGNDVLPFHQPIPLPSGVVIDLKNSGGSVSVLVAQASGGTIDVMFSPRGNVSGYLSGLGPLHFLLRDLRDATAGIDPTSTTQMQTAKGEVLVLSVFPQTGLVQVFEVDTTDVKINATNLPGTDGIADDLFAFARTGKYAGH